MTRTNEDLIVRAVALLKSDLSLTELVQFHILLKSRPDVMRFEAELLDAIKQIEEALDGGDESTEHIPSPLEADPVIPALTSRARDLSLAITNPATLARKLREELEQIAGPSASRLYYIGAEFDGTDNVSFKIARMTPNFVAEFRGDLSSAQLGLSTQFTTRGGWKVAVGVNASTTRDPEGVGGGYSTAGSFSVTITR